jgi:cobalt-zinc-cadmium efflux system membrane fusion protein
MNVFKLFLSRVGAVLVVCAVAVGMAGAVIWVRANSREKAEQPPDNDTGVKPTRDPFTVELSPEAVQSLKIQTDLARLASKPRPLPPLSGSLALDINTLARVNSRFPGEIVEIGTVAPGGKGARKLEVGDHVEPGQLLAVVFCKDLGEKKSELVDTISRLRLSQETLKRFDELYKKGGTSEARVRELEQAVESNLIAVARAERTLSSWMLTEEEIQ